MGARYLILAAGGADPGRLQRARRRLEAADWRETVAGPGFGLWIPAARPIEVRALGGGLLVLGEIARRPGRATARAPQDFDALLSDWCGGYLAFRPTPTGFELLRDPTGAMDVFAWRSDGLACLANDLQGTPRDLQPDQAALDWDVIAGFFRDPVSVWGPSAIAGLRTVAPGEVLALDAAVWSSRQPWRPADFTADNGATADDLVAVVTESVVASAAPHARLLLEVSGGLDSAIVATALAASGEAGRVVTAVNQFASEAESDERALAREVCAAAGVPLACVRKPVGRIDEADLMALAGGVRPAPQASDFIRDRMIAELGRKHDASGVLTGQGGDAVFFQMPTPLIVADLVQARGRRAAFGAEAQATARWLRRSIWSLARQPRRLAAADLVETAFHGWLGARGREGRMINSHAWVRDLGNTPPGKQIQIQTLCAAQMKFGRTLRGEALAVRHPLLSQPVVELCLGIPSWRLTSGRDRGFARTAFAARLPPRVAHRRSKGVLSTLYAKRLVHSLDVVRPWLLDGALCRAQVLDRAALEAALTPEALLWEGQASRLAWAACLEGWVRHWQGRVPDAPGSRR